MGACARLSNVAAMRHSTLPLYLKMFGRALPMRRKSSGNAILNAAADAAAGCGNDNVPDYGGGGKFKSDGGLLPTVTASPREEFAAQNMANNASRSVSGG